MDAPPPEWYTGALGMDEGLFQNERVLVTGGAGFIGSHLCEALLGLGANVCAFDNFDPFYGADIKRRNLDAAEKNENFLLIEGDIRHTADLEKALVWSPTIVVHLAALAGVRPSIAEPSRYMDTNLVGTAKLLQRCAETGIRRFVFASSSSVYGNNRSVPFSESHPVDDPVSPYAASKKAGELLCHSFAHLYEMSVTCLRFFTVYGPRQRPEMAIHKFVRTIVEGQTVTLFGDGSSSRDYTYVDDIVDGTLRAIQKLDGYRIYNLGSSQPIALNALVKEIETKLEMEADIQYWAMQAGDVDRTFADVSLAEKDLGYRPEVTIEDGLHRFVQWYRKRFVLH